MRKGVRSITKNDKSKVICFCCGFPGHTRPNCKYKTLTCTKCKKLDTLRKYIKQKLMLTV